MGSRGHASEAQPMLMLRQAYKGCGGVCLEVCPQVPIRRISNCVQQAHTHSHTRTHTVRRCQAKKMTRQHCFSVSLALFLPPLGNVATGFCSFISFRFFFIFFFIDFSPRCDSNLIVVSIFELHMPATYIYTLPALPLPPLTLS